jgi:hypothetical protein
MDVQHKSRGGPLYWLAGRSRRFWIVAVMLMPVLYFASVGPLVWLDSRDLIPEWSMPVVALYVAPLKFAGENSPATVRAYVWYTSFWRSKEPEEPLYIE